MRAETRCQDQLSRAMQALMSLLDQDFDITKVYNLVGWMLLITLTLSH